MPKVFHFEVWDHDNGKNVTQPLKSTAERIELIGGKIILESAEEVPDSALDAEGRYDPSLEGEQSFPA